ncbi:MAG: archaellin/type IV pilin N-terminal domain-containing protein [Candidatus Aenigmatarchaeota archaeon]
MLTIEQGDCLQMKGISPIIATVLLIAFTVAVAGLLSTWLTGFTSSTSKQVSDSSSITLSCSYGGVSFGSLRFNSSTLYIAGDLENTGTVSLGNFSLQIIYANKSISNYLLCTSGGVGSNCTAKNISLLPRDLITFNVPTSSTYETIRVSTNCSSVFDAATSSEVSIV